MQSIPLSLILLLLLSYCNSEQQLSPLIPPTAFAGNYYTCQFRVLGVDFPKYEFQGLPPSMNGSPSGKVSGSYPVTVSFQVNGIITSANFLFRVIRPIWTPFASQTSSSPPLFIYLEQNSTIFLLGDQIYIKAAAVGGKPPYVWTYLRMPSTLTGDQNGTIRGILNLDGSYSFGVTCADKEGNSGDLFITLNIQPMTFFGKYTIQPVYVQSREPPTSGYWQYILRRQQEASKMFECAFNQTEKLKIKYRQLALIVPEFRNAVLIAQAKVESTIQTVNKSLQIQGRATADLAKANDDLAKKNGSYELALSALAKEQESLKAAKISKQRQQAAFDQAHIQLQKAGAYLIQAQTEASLAVQAVKDKQLMAQTYKLELDYYMNATFQAKKQVENSSIVLQVSSANFSLARNDVQAAKLQNDQAAAQFTLSDKIFNQTTEDLNQANLNVAKVRTDRANATLQLQKANFNLFQLESQLLMAQAAKAEVDKLYEKAKVLRKSYLQTEFCGCQQLSFPSWSGTGQVQKVLKNGVKLTSGESLLWGSCTKKQACKSGDMIFFEGFLKGGSIHALTVSTLRIQS